MDELTNANRKKFLSQLDTMEFLLYDMKRTDYRHAHISNQIPFDDVEPERYAAKFIIILRKYGFSADGILKAQKLKESLKLKIAKYKKENK
jgi:hypothetical protein